MPPTGNQKKSSFFAQAKERPLYNKSFGEEKKKNTLPLMPRWRNSPLNTMNNQGDKATQKERENSPENKLTDVEICDLNDREFRMVLLKKLKKIQINSHQQFRKLKNN